MSELHNVIESPSEVVKQALAYSVNFFNEHHKPKLVFHNFQFCNSLCEQIRTIAHKEQGIQKTEVDYAQLAAIFYTLGIASDRQKPIRDAFSLWQAYASKNDIQPEGIRKVSESINSFYKQKSKQNHVERLLADGIYAQKYAHEDDTQLALFKMESISFEEDEISNLEWNTKQQSILQEINFNYPYSQLHFKPVTNQRLLEYTQKIKRNKRNAPDARAHGEVRKFQNLEKRLPNDATQTFFRANFRNHINLSAIADQKANIMISVNAIMISVLISVLSYRNITETNPMVIMPAVLFLVTGLTSLICAVLSTTPKVTKINKASMPLEEAQKNIVFFGNFVHLELEQYEEAVDAMFRDSELIYGNMVRDLYFLGKVLDQKYKYLSISYHVFMVGFVVTVLTFMAAFLS